MSAQQAARQNVPYSGGSLSVRRAATGRRQAAGTVGRWVALAAGRRSISFLTSSSSRPLLLNAKRWREPARCNPRDSPTRPAHMMVGSEKKRAAVLAAGGALSAAAVWAYLERWITGAPLAVVTVAWLLVLLAVCIMVIGRRHVTGGMAIASQAGALIVSACGSEEKSCSCARRAGRGWTPNCRAWSRPPTPGSSGEDHCGQLDYHTRRGVTPPPVRSVPCPAACAD